MYPEYLLPKAYYHIIQAKHFAENEDLVLIRHIESSEVKYMEGTSILHPDCIKFQSDHLRDLSTNLLGIFTYTDIFYGIQKESRDELCALWNEGSNVRKILPEEFFKDEGRQAYFIPVAITLKYLSDEVQSHKWHFGLFHTPTNCNFWHVSIRVLDENNNEVSQIETIKNNGKRKSGKLLAISWYQTLLVPKNCFINQCLQSVINSNIEVF